MQCHLIMITNSVREMLGLSGPRPLWWGTSTAPFWSFNVQPLMIWWLRNKKKEDKKTLEMFHPMMTWYDWWSGTTGSARRSYLCLSPPSSASSTTFLDQHHIYDHQHDHHFHQHHHHITKIIIAPPSPSTSTNREMCCLASVHSHRFNAMSLKEYWSSISFSLNRIIVKRLFKTLMGSHPTYLCLNQNKHMEEQRLRTIWEGEEELWPKKITSWWPVPSQAFRLVVLRFKMSFNHFLIVLAAPTNTNCT